MVMTVVITGELTAALIVAETQFRPQQALAFSCPFPLRLLAAIAVRVVLLVWV